MTPWTCPRCGTVWDEEPPLLLGDCPECDADADDDELDPYADKP